MRYEINKTTAGENELILNYSSLSPEVERAMIFMDQNRKKLSGRINDEVVIFEPDEILYIEKVDEKTFAYTKDKIIQLSMSLYEIQLFLDSESYFRCSKSMIVNVNKVERLKSLSSNRIDATLQSGEHILISRTYASDFRRLLKGEHA